MSKPVIGVLGFSDGDKAAHEMLKPIVQAQVDAITNALRADGRVEVVVAEDIVHSDKTAKSYAEDLKAKGVDATIFAYGVFAFPVFSVIAARYGKGPYLWQHRLIRTGRVWYPCLQQAAALIMKVSSISVLPEMLTIKMYLRRSSNLQNVQKL